MCIRDRRYTEPQDITDEDATRFQQRFAIDFDAISEGHAKSVSYTHLTLPTSDLV